MRMVIHELLPPLNDLDAAQFHSSVVSRTNTQYLPDSHRTRMKNRILMQIKNQSGTLDVWSVKNALITTPTQLPWRERLEEVYDQIRSSGFPWQKAAVIAAGAVAITGGALYARRLATQP